MISKRGKAVGLGAVLLAWNGYLAANLFTAEHLNYMGSIEGAYIGISR